MIIFDTKLLMNLCFTCLESVSGQQWLWVCLNNERCAGNVSITRFHNMFWQSLVVNSRSSSFRTWNNLLWSEPHKVYISPGPCHKSSELLKPHRNNPIGLHWKTTS
jgi:hypothetical protein